MKKLIYTLSGPFLLLLAWELSIRFHLFTENNFVPSFSEVIKSTWPLIESGVLTANFLSTLSRVLLGFFLGSACGIIIGIIMGASKTADTILNPVFSILMPIPALGWLPILIILLGTNNAVPVIIIFICSFFPVLYNTFRGIRSVPELYIRAAQSLGAPRLRILFSIVLPLSLPNIFTGLKLEAGMAWRTVIAAEMVAIPTGIGALMMRAESLVRFDIIIICLILLSIMTLIFEKTFSMLEKKVTGQWI
jgi:NitT/TauT family transport system permease protein